MRKVLLDIMIWVLFLGGLVGLGVSLLKLVTGAEPSEYGTLGIGGGFWLLSSAIVILIRDRVQS